MLNFYPKLEKGKKKKKKPVLRTVTANDNLITVYS